MNFRSDNEAPAAEPILEAVVQANQGSQNSYGYDDYTARLNDRYSDLFGSDVYVLAMTSGTASNAIALANASPNYGAVFCHEEAHIDRDECGAVGFYGGGLQLIPLAGGQGKLSAGALSDRLAWFGVKGDHEPVASAVSITQATECGTVYKPEEIAAISEVAREHSMILHMDGARFANAVATLGCHPADITHSVGVQYLSFGATKNGAINAEAVIVFDPELIDGLRRRRMKGGHLMSKMRFVSAQLLAYIEDGLWLDLAARANDGARRVATALDSNEAVELAYPCEANEVFAHLPVTLADRLKDRGFAFHPWPGTPDLYRFVIPWNVDEAHLEALETALSGR